MPNNVRSSKVQPPRHDTRAAGDRREQQPRRAPTGARTRAKRAPVHVPSAAAPAPEHALDKLIAAADGPDRELLLSYILPLSYGPVRHADAFGARPTALARPWAQLDAAWFNRPAPAVGYPSNFALDALLILLRHDPKEFLMVTDFTMSRLMVDGAGAGANTVTYACYYDGAGSAVTRTVRPGEWLDFSFATSLGSYARKGTTYWPKQIGDRQCIWLDVAPTGSAWPVSRMRIMGGMPFDVNRTYMFTVRNYVRGGFMDWTYNTVGNGTTQLDLAIMSGNNQLAGYYVARYDGQYVTASGPAAVDSTPYFYGVRTIEYCDGVAIYALPGLVANEGVVDELRILGSSVMFTNDAAPQVRAGKRAQYQMGGAVPVDTCFYPPDGSTTFAHIASNQGAVSEDVEEGAYSWRRPGHARDWDMVPFDGPSSNPGSGMPNSGSSDTSDYVCMAINAPLPGAGATQTPQAGRITYGCGVEFETEDTWRVISPPTFDTLVYQRVMTRLRYIEQHHTNKRHILELMKSVGRVLRKSIGPASRVLGLVPDPRAQAAATMLGTADNVLTRFGV